MDLGKITLQTTVAFLFMLIFTRILGKKQMSQLTFFNYVTGISFGSIAAAMAVDKSINIWEGITSLAIWTVLNYATGFLSLKSTKARIFFDGEPTIVIKKGKILEEAMSAMRFNIDDLSMMLREQSIFSTTEVEYAILEPNGQLSVMLKRTQDPVTKSDLKISTEQPSFVPTEIISDGTILARNLKELNLDQKWLNQQLQTSGITNVKDVFYAEIQPDGTLYIDKRLDQIH